MATIRFRSRFLHATVFDYTTAALDALGWINAPVNFGTAPITVVDYQPEERGQQIAKNTVAVSLADYTSDEDEELGAALHGTRSAPYSVFIDVFMSEQALAYAICDDLRDIFTDKSFYLVDQITLLPTSNLIQVEFIEGPSRITSSAGTDVFKKHWRAMRIDCRLYFQS